MLKPMVWIGVAIAGVGVLSWAHTVWRFWPETGQDGFDMSSASAFDLRWTRGALLLGFGVGVATWSAPVGVGVSIAGFLGSMLAKPLLRRLAGRGQR